jgi:hypothetical protein
MARIEAFHNFKGTEKSPAAKLKRAFDPGSNPGRCSSFIFYPAAADGSETKLRLPAGAVLFRHLDEIFK